MGSTLNELTILLLIAAIGGIWFALMSFLKPGSSPRNALKIWLVAAALAFAASLIPWSLGGFDPKPEDYHQPNKYGDRPY